jgi:chemotaxis protein MotB
VKKKEKKEDNSERWLLTYSDLITLLMALFVILYASSNVDKAKYKQISSSLHQAFNMNDSGNIGVIQGNPITGSSEEEETEQNENTQLSEEEKLDSIKNQIDALIAEAGLQASVSTKIEDRGLVISFTDSVFFESGKAIVKDDHKKQLVEISKVLNKIDNNIKVEGNTDNVAIKNDEFKSNWALSSMRATNVLEILINECKISPSRLSSVGNGEYRPTATNATEEGRAANRRVDIVIVNKMFNDSKATNK